jgi:hypothetical protein
MFEINHQYSLSPFLKEENRNKLPSQNNFEVALLDENDFNKFKIFDGSILKAISMALFFTTKYSEKIKEIICENLRKMVQQNNLNERLQIFGSNISLIREFNKNIESPENEKVN